MAPQAQPPEKGVVILAIFYVCISFFVVPDKKESCSHVHAYYGLTPFQGAIDFLILPPVVSLRLTTGCYGELSSEQGFQFIFFSFIKSGLCLFWRFLFFGQPYSCAAPACYPHASALGAK